MLDGSAPGALADDAAIAACAEHPVPVLSAAMGFTAVRRAARLGAGLLFDSLSTPERCRELIDDYHAHGGTGSCVLIRRAWLGEPPRERLDDQIDVYRSYSSSAAMEHWGGDELVDAPTRRLGGGRAPRRPRTHRRRRAEPAGPRARRLARRRPGADRPPGRRGARPVPGGPGRLKFDRSKLSEERHDERRRLPGQRLRQPLLRGDRRLHPPPRSRSSVAGSSSGRRSTAASTT